MQYKNLFFLYFILRHTRIELLCLVSKLFFPFWFAVCVYWFFLYILYMKNIPIKNIIMLTTCPNVRGPTRKSIPSPGCLKNSTVNLKTEYITAKNQNRKPFGSFRSLIIHKVENIKRFLNDS